MSDLRRRFHENIARLDGARERRVIAIGATAVLMLLLLGPKAIRAVQAFGDRRASVFKTPAVPEAAPAIAAAAPTPAPVSSPAVAEAAETSAVQAPSFPTPPAVASKLSLLSPAADATLAPPARISARISGAIAVNVLFAVADANGDIRNLPAIPAGDPGVWQAAFDAEPGPYVLSARASFGNGFVQDYPDRLAFRVTGRPEVPMSAMTEDATAAPNVEVLAPSDGTFDGATPLYAGVNGALPDRLVFVIGGADGRETVVPGDRSANGLYWSGYFEGPDGAYDVRARATVSGTDITSDAHHFTLKRQTP